MIQRICFMVALFCCSVCSGYGQLYLLTGSPTEKYPESFASALIVVDPDGAVKELTELVPQSIGTEWINVSYDLKKAILLSRYKEDSVVVIDFQSASVVKRCRRPDSAGRSLIYSWLANP